ncbi:MAG: 3-phenylpropionate/cinnamic acid dioxygenase subunit beta [Parvibaculaceae bacterium]|nr:3-phenylpropionate/cinnamic acid dioxygenase subunit beta [Parvibaculaceae bacterium]
MSVVEKVRAPIGLSLQEQIVLQFEVEQFLYEEAALLDGREYRAWLDVLTDDIHYWMPIRRTVTLSNIDQAFTKAGDMSFYEDDKNNLTFRVNKMESASSWSEDPPSRSRHFVSNVRILEVNGDEVTTECAFHLYRSRLNTEESSFFGRREDVLRRVEGKFLLAQRHIFLDQTLIRATNMSTLF